MRHLAQKKTMPAPSRPAAKVEAIGLEELSQAGVASNSKDSLLVSLLTGGDDRPYALGMVSALIDQGVAVEFIGSDALDEPLLHESPLIKFLNLRGDQSETATFGRKVVRILAYYARLFRYAATGKPRVFHILWNNKFELIDRTFLMLYYRALAKRVVLTAHNVNTRKRDGRDNWINRLSLRVQYRLCHHIFVHTERMKTEILSDFSVPESRVSVIPFGINNTIPCTDMTRPEARRLLGVPEESRLALFFGQIAPYKGLEYLVDAMRLLAEAGEDIRLIIAGKVKRGCEDYWHKIQEALALDCLRDCVIQRIQFIADDNVEQYFKASDVAVLPYVSIFQSGVPFLAYSFGLPVIASDVGSMREDIVEGTTGFVYSPSTTQDLAKALRSYFASELYRCLDSKRSEIQSFANERNSWAIVGERIVAVYRRLLDA